MAATDLRTLCICREARVYKIPPRSGADGYRSGDWRVADKIFDGVLRVMAAGERIEIRLEDQSSGELFAVCPFTIQERSTAVEPVTDSARYFVFKVVDSSSGRHAFLGVGFDDRATAFDFTAALDDHERHEKRAQLSRQAAASQAQQTGQQQQQQQPDAEFAALYQSRGDMSLKEGQTIHVALKNKSDSGAAKDKKDGAGERMPIKLAPLAPPPVGIPPGQTSMPSVQLQAPKTNEGSSAKMGEGDWATFD